MEPRCLTNLVSDWGGFEKLVAKIHETGDVEVRHNIVLVGKSGCERQIDVLVEYTKDLYRHRIIIECKHWQKNVERLHVDALATTVDDLNASKGVMFSSKGFQEGAKIAGEHYGIDLFVVREPTDAEWGLPGRVIDIFIQVMKRSVGNVRFENVLFAGPPGVTPSLNIVISDDQGGTATPTVRSDGTPGPTLEALIADVSMKALNQVTKDAFTLNGGQDSTAYLIAPNVQYAPSSPVRVTASQGVVSIQKITFDLAIKIAQSHLVHDRAKDHLFVLAVEDCLRKTVTAASRRSEEAETTLSPMREPGAPEAKDAVVNGSILRVVVKGFFPFAEIEGKESVDLQSVLRKRELPRLSKPSDEAG